MERDSQRGRFIFIRSTYVKCTLQRAHLLSSGAGDRSRARDEQQNRDAIDRKQLSDTFAAGAKDERASAHCRYLPFLSLFFISFSLSLYLYLYFYFYFYLSICLSLFSSLSLTFLFSAASLSLSSSPHFAPFFLFPEVHTWRFANAGRSRGCIPVSIDILTRRRLKRCFRRKVPTARRRRIVRRSFVRIERNRARGREFFSGRGGKTSGLIPGQDMTGIKLPLINRAVLFYRRLRNLDVYCSRRLAPRKRQRRREKERVKTKEERTPSSNVNAIVVLS